jgi:hypothetical protein
MFGCGIEGSGSQRQYDASASRMQPHGQDSSDGIYRGWGEDYVGDGQPVVHSTM